MYSEARSPGFERMVYLSSLCFGFSINITEIIIERTSQRLASAHALICKAFKAVPGT